MTHPSLAQVLTVPGRSPFERQRRWASLQERLRQTQAHPEAPSDWTGDTGQTLWHDWVLASPERGGSADLVYANWSIHATLIQTTGVSITWPNAAGHAPLTLAIQQELWEAGRLLVSLGAAAPEGMARAALGAALNTLRPTHPLPESLALVQALLACLRPREHTVRDERGWTLADEAILAPTEILELLDAWGVDWYALPPDRVRKSPYDHLVEGLAAFAPDHPLQNRLNPNTWREICAHRHAWVGRLHWRAALPSAAAVERTRL